jgi:exodeoxyribonuclease-3
LLYPNYRIDWNFAQRSGYAGSVCLFRKKPIGIIQGIENEKFDAGGRVITLEYPALFFVNVYVPNSQDGLAKWYYCLEWDDAFCEYAADLNKRKPVIIGGDFTMSPTKS